jgi:hypothetical protein
LTAIGINNRWDQLAEQKWEQLTRTDDIELRPLAVCQNKPDMMRAKQLLAQVCDFCFSKSLIFGYR